MTTVLVNMHTRLVDMKMVAHVSTQLDLYIDLYMERSHTFLHGWRTKGKLGFCVSQCPNERYVVPSLC